MPDDAELLEAWRGGDEASGNRLLRRYYAAVRRFFEFKVPAAAEDLTQATFLACVEGRERILGAAQVRSYLFGIARRKLLMYLRDESRFASALAFRKAQGPDSVVSPSGVVALRQEQRLLLAAIQQLPPDHQIALQLFYWERLKNREIAEVLEIPMSTVGNRLARARQQIRTLLAEMHVPAQMQDDISRDFDRWAASLVQPGAASD